MAEKFYFAYGANMNQAEMLGQCPGARWVGDARLNGWRLVFTHDSPRWLGGICDIIKLASPLDTPKLDPAGLERSSPEQCPLSPVRGVLWDVSGLKLTALHGAHDYHPGGPPADNDCEPIKVEVLLLGELTRHVTAFAYQLVRKDKKHRPPHDGYMDTVIRGARQHGLPEEYVDQLSAIHTLGEDPRFHSHVLL